MNGDEENLDTPPEDNPPEDQSFVDEALQTGAKALSYHPMFFSTQEHLGTEKEWNPYVAFSPGVQAVQRGATVAETQDPGVGVTAPELTVAGEAFRNAQQNLPSAQTRLSGPQGATVGTGKSKFKARFETTLTPEVPGEYRAEQIATEKERTDLEYAYQQERAKTLGIMVDIGTAFADDIEKSDRNTLQKIDGLISRAEAEVQGIDELIRRAEGNHINPGQFFANIGDAGTFAAALAVGVGSLATAMGGGPNAALSLIESAIERNVRAQVINQEHDRAIIGHKVNFANMIRGLSNDRAQQGNYARAAMYGMAKARMGIEMNRLMGTQAKLAAQDAYLKLGARLIKAKIDAITNSAAKVSYEVNSLAQARQVQHMLGLGGQAQPLAAQGRGRGRGGAKAPQVQAGDAFEKARQTLETELKAGTDIAKAVRTATHEYGALLGGNPTPEQKMAFVSAIEAIAQAQPNKERSLAVSNEASRLLDADFRSADFTVDTTAGPVGVFIRDPSIWNKVKDNPEHYRILTSAVQGLADVQLLADKMRAISLAPDIPILRELPLDENGDVTLDALFNGDKTRDYAIINQIAKSLTKQAHLRDSGDARNAMNLQWERVMAESIAGTKVTLTQFITEALSNSPKEIRLGRLGMTPERTVQYAKSIAQSLGLYIDFGQ